MGFAYGLIYFWIIKFYRICTVCNFFTCDISCNSHSSRERFCYSTILQMKNLKIMEIKYNSEITELVNMKVRIQAQFGVSSETKHVTTLNLMLCASAHSLQSLTKHFLGHLSLSFPTYWFYDLSYFSV